MELNKGKQWDFRAIAVLPQALSLWVRLSSVSWGQLLKVSRQ